MEIYAHRKTGWTCSEITKLIGAHRSTVSREIRKNRGLKGYRFRQAHKKALLRRRTACKKIRFTAEIKAKVIERLKDDWSPEQISGRLRVEGRPSVSHETIYRFILDDQRQGGELYRHLRLGRKKRRKRKKTKDRRGQIPNRVSIDDRPTVVDERARTGDWELDTMIGKNHRGALITIVEQKTGFALIGRLRRRAVLLVSELSSHKSMVPTIFEDGKENSEPQAIAGRLDADFFFARPDGS